MPLLKLTHDNCELYEFLSCRDLLCHGNTVWVRAVSTELLQPCLHKAVGSKGSGGPPQHNVLHGSDLIDVGTTQVQQQALSLFTASVKEIINAYLQEMEK